MTGMTRRRVLGSAAAGAASLAGPRAARAAQGPNIVFIMADDLGYADIAAYGRPDLATPQIDRIAATGVRFTQAYANSAVCSATRTALITGRYQYRLPVGLEEPVTTRFAGGLPAEQPTLPGLLRQAGYRTALVGKWHLGSVRDCGPLQRGYDAFWGFRGGTIDYFSHRGTDDKPDLWDGDVRIEEVGYATHLLGRHAVETIAASAKAGRPFFLSLHFNAPHWPWEAPEDEAESRRIAGSNLRHFDGGTQATYRRIVAEMDIQVGRVLDALEANGVAEDTIVVFTSDNGGERFSDTWPFTGRKTELLEGGLRIPALVSWPRRLKAGQVSNQAMITMDWLPTLLAAAGTAPDPGCPPDGIDLLPILTGQAPERPRTFFWRYRANAQAAMRDGDLKYLKIRDQTFLFDVVADPLERANLKARRPEDFARLQSAWTAWDATMLPERAESFSETYTGAQLADHFGAGAPAPK
ncbi:twin-arginine translocation pathway signal protein [Methylobacterium platani JCM 14648]|uniref:Twin-arginine translocation pathway signal protein n=3 Tax=Methylobacterium platani TaxID=427683 RepID=A0A179SGB2_9HYPH|nr:twin-arginine translocation pathway signal protein [Methylobacterium platani JCM 14648]OAS26489.1 twin-arginine translocation pathway signal protein [Methylobacterium platani]